MSRLHLLTRRPQRPRIARRRARASWRPYHRKDTNERSWTSEVCEHVLVQYLLHEAYGCMSTSTCTAVVLVGHVGMCAATLGTTPGPTLVVRVCARTLMRCASRLVASLISLGFVCSTYGTCTRDEMWLYWPFSSRLFIFCGTDVHLLKKSCEKLRITDSCRKAPRNHGQREGPHRGPSGAQGAADD